MMSSSDTLQFLFRVPDYDVLIVYSTFIELIMIMMSLSKTSKRYSFGG